MFEELLLSTELGGTCSVAEKMRLLAPTAKIRMKVDPYYLLLLGGELLAERCHTDDLMPSISLLCLPPCRVNPEIL